MRGDARAALAAAAEGGGLLVSVVSAWEIGLLVRKNRLVLELTPLLWLERFLDRPGLRLLPLPAGAALLSSCVPEPFHGDPADRMLVAAARETGAVLVTRDARILAYAEAGHVRAMAC